MSIRNRPSRAGQAQRTDPATREQLVERHLGLVHHVVRGMSSHVQKAVPRDELVTAGAIGLMQAIDSFDASRGLAFSTFAKPRIRGAILDEIRREDPTPRSVRQRERLIATARESLAQAFGRQPVDRELAEHIGTDAATLWRWKRDVESIRPVSLSEPTSDAPSRSPTIPSELTHRADERIEESLNLHQEIAILKRHIRRLGEREQMVLKLRYFEELPVEEVASLLEISASRVSQIAGCAIAKLRAAMTPLRSTAA